MKMENIDLTIKVSFGSDFQKQVLLKTIAAALIAVKGQFRNAHKNNFLEYYVKETIETPRVAEEFRKYLTDFDTEFWGGIRHVSAGLVPTIEEGRKK